MITLNPNSFLSIVEEKNGAGDLVALIEAWCSFGLLWFHFSMICVLFYDVFLLICSIAFTSYPVCVFLFMFVGGYCRC